jgi:hypothetical protein
VLWDDLIAKFGDEPDVERLTQCFKVWVARGFKEINLAWATDWYFNGIPERLASFAPKAAPQIAEESWEKDDFDSWIPVHELLLSSEDFHSLSMYESWRDSHLQKRPQDRGQVESYENSVQFQQRFQIGEL